MNYSELVPQRLDLFAFIIFVGIVQGFFFSYFLLKKAQRLDDKHKFLGISLLMRSLVMFEVFMCYTGWITHALWLVDYSEFINFLNGPVLLFLVMAFIGKTIPKRYYLHFIPAGLYLLYSGFFFVQSSAFKFNAFIDAYYPNMAAIQATEVINPDPIGIKGLTNPLGVLYTLVYIIFATVYVVRAMKEGQIKLFKGASRDMAWFRNYLILGIISFLFWLVKSFIGLRDVDDHIGGVLETIIIYYVGFKILSDRLSGTKIVSEKYSRSSLDEDRKQHILLRLNKLMGEEKLFLQNDLSLTELAQRCKSSNHHVSQVLNEALGKSFVEYINELRIAYSQTVLQEQSHLKIEEVAELSGYNSKSTFNTAFKKITGQTPSEYRNLQEK